jgi:hypothetical protein
MCASGKIDEQILRFAGWSIQGSRRVTSAGELLGCSITRIVKNRDAIANGPNPCRPCQGGAPVRMVRRTCPAQNRETAPWSRRQRQLEDSRSCCRSAAATPLPGGGTGRPLFLEVVRSFRLIEVGNFKKELLKIVHRCVDPFEHTACHCRRGSLCSC